MIKPSFFQPWQLNSTNYHNYTITHHHVAQNMLKFKQVIHNVKYYYSSVGAMQLGRDDIPVNGENRQVLREDQKNKT